MHSKPLRVFIIDDDRSFGRSLVRLLTLRGFAPEYFSSAQFFLDSISADDSGIAVVDIHMPGCDGFMLFDRMQELHYRAPVIFITGAAQADEPNVAIRKGARGFLLKPFGESSLLEMLNK